jgi:repressor LexA
MSFGTRLRNLRKKKGLTQDELGELIGVKKAAIQKLESDSVQSLKISSIKTLCEFFNISSDQLLLEKEDYLKREAALFRYISCNYGPNAAKIFGTYLELSEDNKEKALDYVEDMLIVDKYLSGGSRVPVQVQDDISL